MKRFLMGILALTLICQGSKPVTGALEKNFRQPPVSCRPMPFWHLNGVLNQRQISGQISDAGQKAGFGGVTVLPVSAGPQHPTGKPCPGMAPEYLSEEYFDLYEGMLKTAKREKMELILYDDIDFPSGNAAGRLQREFPQYTRKFIEKEEFLMNGPIRMVQRVADDSTRVCMAVSAMNVDSKEVIDLGPCVKDKTLTWDVPEGSWRIMLFNCRYNANRLVDYMEPKAVRSFIRMAYDPYDHHFSNYFGNVVRKVFFDDVGYVSMEQTWNPEITRRFTEQYGKSAALYYPALYYDIGPETEAARVAFYDIRAELMAEGYPRMVGDWCAQRGLQSIGHPPGNYCTNPTDMHGDILKFYRHTQIPLTDYIFYYGHGRDGFKQVSSAADLYDRPVVGAEVCGAFDAGMDSLMLYRTALDLFARGVNFLIPHGMWYDPAEDHVRIPPLISPYNPRLAPALRQYSDFAARCCAMLQGGARMCDIALVYPIASAQAHFRLGAAEPWGESAPPSLDYHSVGALLSTVLRQDFTLVHPESILNDKVVREKDRLVLDNRNNRQEYRIVILPGGKVFSARVMEKILDFYENGGCVIATSLLPAKSSEFGQDVRLRTAVDALFGPAAQRKDAVVRSAPRNGGKAVFLSHPNASSLRKALEELRPDADVEFGDTGEHYTVSDNAPKTNKMTASVEETLQNTPEDTVGRYYGYHPNGASFCYIHKQKDNRHIYLFTNSSDDSFSTPVWLRGRMKLQRWDPYTGTCFDLPSEVVQKHGQSYTHFMLDMPAVRGCFVVGQEVY